MTNARNTVLLAACLTTFSLVLTTLCFATLNPWLGVMAFCLALPAMVLSARALGSA